MLPDVGGWVGVVRCCGSTASVCVALLLDCTSDEDFVGVFTELSEERAEGLPCCCEEGEKGISSVVFCGGVDIANILFWESAGGE